MCQAQEFADEIGILVQIELHLRRKNNCLNTFSTSDLSSFKLYGQTLLFILRIPPI